MLSASHQTAKTSIRSERQHFLHTPDLTLPHAETGMESAATCSYLQPLRLVAVSRRPSVDLALFVQPGLSGLPGEHIHVDGPEDTRSSDLVVLDVARFHSHGLGAAWEQQKHNNTGGKL